MSFFNRSRIVTSVNGIPVKSKSYDVLHSVKVVSKVWYLVGIDPIDAGKMSGKGNRYLLTTTDYFSKYVEAIPLPDKSALSVTKGLYKAYCRHGAPAHIISDQGRDFVNQVHIRTEGFACQLLKIINDAKILTRKMFRNVFPLLIFTYFVQYPQEDHGRQQ